MGGGRIGQILPLPVGQEIRPQLRRGPMLPGERVLDPPRPPRRDMGLGLCARSIILGGRGRGVRIIIIGGKGKGVDVRFVRRVHRTSTGRGGLPLLFALDALPVAVILAAPLSDRIDRGGRVGLHLGDRRYDRVMRHPGREHVLQGGGDDGHAGRSSALLHSRQKPGPRHAIKSSPSRTRKM